MTAPRVSSSLYTRLATAAVLFAGLLAGSAPARACGGTFCDSGPNSMPVDQTGESVLFVIDETHVEAHIQIQIDPDSGAEEFAWLIPVRVLPEFSVGSERLFDNLLAGTVPTYGYNRTSESCAPVDKSSDGGGAGDGDGDPTTGGSGDGDGDTEPEPDPGPTIVLQEVVGAFEIAVLQGGSIDEVMQWLGDNGYQQDPNAEPILDQYLQEGYLFVALKLAVNAEVAEVHPIVLRYPGDEPCVPLRLTRIAAVEDMDVRVFMLGNARAAPSNYRQVQINELQIDWMEYGSNYKEVVSMAVDAFAAEGHAFVTEYAGASAVVSSVGLYRSDWDASVFAELQASPEQTIELLAMQGLAECWSAGCQASEDLVQGLLDQYLPVPASLDPIEFYGCLSCYAGLIDTQAWDAAGFAAELDERLIQPGLHAAALLETWPQLTRLYTTISPHEMTVDPVFHQNPELPVVRSLHFGTRESLCNGDAVFRFPNGRERYMPMPSRWLQFPAAMPWNEVVEQAVKVGPSQILSDRTVQIDAQLAAWNAKYHWGPNGLELETPEDALGCACAVRSTNPGGPLVLFGLVGIGSLLRRRRWRRG